MHLTYDGIIFLFEFIVSSDERILKIS